MTETRKYYKKGKTLLYDDLLQGAMEAIEAEVTKLPEQDQKKAYSKATKKLLKELDPIMEKIKDDIIARSRKDVKKALREDEKYKAGFEKRLYKNNKDLLDRYNALVSICLEAVQRHREITFDNVGEKDKLFPLLLRLHARACRIANEILALTRAGYGTGALARWRAMHEIVVVLSYIREHGIKAAKAFEDYSAISSYKAMLDYQRYCKALGQKPFSAAEVRKSKDRYDRMVTKYGKQFKDDYGWAKYISGGTINNFRDLELSAGIDHLRPYYRLSSLGVHAEWRSLTTGEEFEALSNDGIALVGAADYGFEDAMSLAMVTVSHATSIILTYNHAMFSLVYAKIIITLEREAQDVLGHNFKKRSEKDPSTQA